MGDWERIFSHLKVKFNFPLKKISTIGIGGRCRCWIEISDEKTLLNVFSLIEKHNLRWYVVGKMSNVLFSDENFRGVVLKINLRGIKILEEGAQDGVLAVGAGEELNRLVKSCLNLGFSGVEHLAGIPGTVGGAIKLNAGAFGHSISEVVSSVRIFSLKEGLKILNKDDLDFGYRSSSIKDGEVVLTAFLKLRKEKRTEIFRKISTYLKLRRQSQPRGRSLGSVFKNPKEGFAGKLIEDAGLKGYRVGGAVISQKHANFILNKNKATFTDVYELIQIAKSRVWDLAHIELEEEINIVR